MRLTFALLAALEPRLLDLLAVARQLAPDDWPGYEAHIKAPLAELVGFYAPDDTLAALRTPEAYEAAIAHLVDAFEQPIEQRLAA